MRVGEDDDDDDDDRHASTISNEKDEDQNIEKSNSI